MRLLGVRSTIIFVGLGLLAATLGVLGAGSNGPGSLRYEVSASVSTVNGQTVACLASMNPESCGVIPVRGLDVARVRNFEWYPGSPLMTQVLRMVGTWDGRALTLTEPAQPADSASPWPEPCGFLPPGSVPEPKMLALQDRVSSDRAWLDQRGIRVLGTGACDGTLGIIVAVADPDTVNLLRRQYGTVTVVGWLRPVRSNF